MVQRSLSFHLIILLKKVCLEGMSMVASLVLGHLITVGFLIMEFMRVSKRRLDYMDLAELTTIPVEIS